MGFRKVAGPLRRSRHGKLLQGCRRELMVPFLLGEEEDLVAIAVELSGDVERAAKIPSRGSVPVDGARLAVVIVQPGVGIHALVAVVPEAGAVEVPGTGLGNHGNLGSRA